MPKCKSRTKNGKKCKNYAMKFKENCFIHLKNEPYIEKEKNCIVCTEEIPLKDIPCKPCNHFVAHRKCQIRHGRYCMMCRREIILSKEEERQVLEQERERERERLEEEERNLRRQQQLENIESILNVRYEDYNSEHNFSPMELSLINLITSALLQSESLNNQDSNVELIIHEIENIPISPNQFRILENIDSNLVIINNDDNNDNNNDNDNMDIDDNNNNDNMDIDNYHSPEA